MSLLASTRTNSYYIFSSSESKSVGSTSPFLSRAKSDLVHKFLETCDPGASNQGNAVHDAAWDAHGVESWSQGVSAASATTSSSSSAEKTSSSSSSAQLRYTTCAKVASSAADSSSSALVDLSQIDLTKVENPYQLLPPIDYSVLLDWENEPSSGETPIIEASTPATAHTKPVSPSGDPASDTLPAAPVVDEFAVAPMDVDVHEETLEKMEKEKWSGVNGCYDDAGDWRDWTQIVSLTSYGGGDLNILPYVDIDG